MRASWHKWWLLAAALTACSLNPQPDLPGDRVTGSGGAGGIGINTGAGGSLAFGGAPGAAAGSDSVAVPPTDAGAPGEGGAGHGAGGEGGADEAAGASTVVLGSAGSR